VNNIKPIWIVIGGLLAAAVLAGAIGYFALISPQGSKLSGLNDQLATAQSELVAAQGAKARPVAFHLADLYQLATAMPDQSDMPGILLDLTRVAGRSSVALTAVRPSPTVPLALGYSALPLVVNVSGTYANVTKFLAVMRHDVRLSSDKLNVKGRLFVANEVQFTGSTQSNVLTAQLNLDAFVYAPPVTTLGLPPTATTPTATGAVAAGAPSTGGTN
jgi:Pilus assembly protein, PilO